MSKFVKRVRALFLIAVMGMLVSTFSSTAHAQVGRHTAFCKKLFNPNLNPNGKIFGSQGAQMYCFGSQLSASNRR
ncbi:MAG: hypothetical protein JOY93_02080, partial [Acidobacteriales bacterium]|nr:hypothetical protein [Terriglobales bacterium]